MAETGKERKEGEIWGIEKIEVMGENKRRNNLQGPNDDHYMVVTKSSGVRQLRYVVVPK